MRKKNKNFLNLMLYSMLILSVIDFFHFANHAFAHKSHNHHTTDYSYEIVAHILRHYDNFRHISSNTPLDVESKSCQICSSLFHFEAIIPNNIASNFNHISTVKYTLIKEFASPTLTYFYKPRGPPVFV